MPNENGYSHFLIQRTEEAILRARETIQRSREVLRVSREIQADREKIERKSRLILIYQQTNIEGLKRLK